MVSERQTWNLSESNKQKPDGEESTLAPAQPAGIRHGVENMIRIAWTMTCFVVFCGFSFFLGWHLRGWHFSAYYEAPTVDLMGAKTAYHAPVITTPPDDISQAKPEGSR